ncbi:hypothetical protein ACPXCE_08645 [Streptomyces sp. DT24]|uniref:hypothetical protein n=1 Tax=unclassified Streptomyces TaxID=2593676 RepID=UPI0023B91724|nr:hypothetical protein [Streptomyces sp. AM 4-1-1]WEH33514.1 hypothetical protein PZB75_09085 [Streptomyces sp. AM 4-1-1]
MRITHLRRFGLTAIIALALAMLGMAQPASADDTPDLSFAVAQTTATPGSSVDITMTLTNNQTTDIWFVYQSLQPTWLTAQRTDVKYSFTSCTSEGVTCTGTGTTSLGVNYAIPLAPGASRTVTLTYQIAADSGCNADIAFYSYLYYEYNYGQSVKDGTFNAPSTRVTCVTPPAPEAVRS